MCTRTHMGTHAMARSRTQLSCNTMLTFGGVSCQEHKQLASRGKPLFPPHSSSVAHMHALM